MALNYSRRASYSFEDTMVSPMRVANGYLVEGVSEKNGEGYSRPCCHGGQGDGDVWNFDRLRDIVENCTSPELTTSNDIVDLLPSDPFGMDIETTCTAITRFLKDFEVDYGGYCTWKDNFDSSGWSVYQDNTVNVRLDMGNQSFPSTYSFPCNVLQYGQEFHGELRNAGGELAQYLFGCQPSGSSEVQTGESVESEADYEGMPHEALFFALGYLGVKDLLTVEMVCSSLCWAVRDDPLLWMSIHLNKNERITDDVLVQLASRAQGKLQCLNLVECPRITDDGLRRVLETNPLVTMLYVPGCTRVSIEGILNNVKTYNSNKDTVGIRHLRIAGIYGVTHDIFEQLKLLLGVDSSREVESHQNKHFYSREDSYLPFEDNRAIDIEMCPRCETFRLIYDCPADSCKFKGKGSSEACRGCTLCIARCAQCGRCVNDTEHEENFCLDLLCSDCFKVPLEYQDIQQKKGMIPSYHFGFDG